MGQDATSRWEASSKCVPTVEMLGHRWGFAGKVIKSRQARPLPADSGQVMG